MKSKIVCICCCCLGGIFLLSCSKKKEENSLEAVPLKKAPVVVDVDMKSDENTLPLDSLFEFVSAVKLETTNDNLLGDVWDILFLDDKIIVEDMEYTKSLTVYDQVGNYLHKIGMLGQAPNEYAFLDYVSADSNGIRLTDIGGQKIMQFDLNGNMLQSVKMPFFAERCELLSDNMLVSQSDGGIVADGIACKPRIVVSDLQGNVSFSAFPTDHHENYHLSIVHPMRKFKNDLFFIPPYNDTIYQITKEGIYPHYILDIKRQGDINQDDKINTKQFVEKLKTLSAYFEGDFVELKDYTLFGIREPNMWPRFVVYAKNRKCSYYCDGNYKDARLRFSLNKRFYCKDNLFVTFASATDVLSFKKELYRLCPKDEIDALLSGLTEDDNPVLFFYKIKI